MLDAKTAGLALFVGLIGLMLTYQVIKTLRSGVISDNDAFDSSRAEQPSVYWFGVGVQTILALSAWAVIAIVMTYRPL